jgi:hypothetical protein
MLKAAIVTTTIYDNDIIEGYFKNFQKYGRLDTAEVFVIPDRKTPARVYERCQELQSQGLRVTCPTLEEQETFLYRVGLHPDDIPYNSDNRRNIGFLMALESQVDFIISIDDDNFCLEDDFFGAHAIVCQKEVEAEVIDTSSGWYNICELLNFDHSGPVYPRGFPYFARHRQENVDIITARTAVHVNAGLWLQSPDIDGISWLVNPVSSQSHTGRSIVLGPNTWTPVNTQNTALQAEAVAAYYYIRMGYPLMGGLPIDRYGDIFAGYFLQACMHHLGGALRVGTPVVEHRRHGHDYLNDALREIACIALTEELLPWLTQEARLQGSTYREAYTSLSYLLEDAVETFHGRLWNDSTRGYFHQTAHFMRKWVRACQSLLG